MTLNSTVDLVPYELRGDMGKEVSLSLNTLDDTQTADRADTFTEESLMLEELPKTILKQHITAFGNDHSSSLQRVSDEEPFH